MQENQEKRDADQKSTVEQSAEREHEQRDSEQGGQMGQGGNEPGAIPVKADTSKESIADCPEVDKQHKYEGLEESVEFAGKDTEEPHPEHAHITSSLVEQWQEYLD